MEHYELDISLPFNVSLLYFHYKMNEHKKNKSDHTHKYVNNHSEEEKLQPFFCVYVFMYLTEFESPNETGNSNNNNNEGDNIDEVDNTKKMKRNIKQNWRKKNFK